MQQNAVEIMIKPPIAIKSRLQQLSLTHLSIRYQGPIFLACKIRWKRQHKQIDLMSVGRWSRQRRLRFAESVR